MTKEKKPIYAFPTDWKGETYKTGEPILEFDTVSWCAWCLSVSPKTVSQRLKDGKPLQTFFCGYLLGHDPDAIAERLGGTLIEKKPF